MSPKKVAWSPAKQGGLAIAAPRGEPAALEHVAAARLAAPAEVRGPMAMVWRGAGEPFALQGGAHAAGPALAERPRAGCKRDRAPFFRTLFP